MTGAAWTAYWQEGGSTCLPGAPAVVQRALASHWQQRARSLPRRARVLDLAAGAGAVLSTMRAVRRDLELTGVDQATLPAGPPGCHMLSAIDCSALPFEDGSFHLVTSQFGIEYCPPDAVDEAARVLAPDGAMHWLLHAADSPATRHNAARLAAMRAMIDAGLFRLARQAAAGFEDQALGARLHAVRAAHQHQGIAAELPAALAQALNSRAPMPTIAAIEQKAASEMDRLQAMAAAALSEEAAQALTARLNASGIAARLQPLMVANEGKIAWIISGTRPAGPPRG